VVAVAGQELGVELHQPRGQAKVVGGVGPAERALILDINAQLVGEIDQLGNGRVMGRAQGVEVGFLQELEVEAGQRGVTAGPSGDGIVMAGAADLDRLAIDEKPAVANVGLAESDTPGRRLDASPVRLESNASV